MRFRAGEKANVWASEGCGAGPGNPNGCGDRGGGASLGVTRIVWRNCVPFLVWRRVKALLLGTSMQKEQELRRDRRIILLLADWLLVEKREACQRSTRDDNKLYAETRLFCEAKNRIA